MVDLDDLDAIKKGDPSGALKVAAKQYEQLLHDFDTDLSHLSKPANVVLVGMGGSALAGLAAKAWLDEELPVPFEVVRNYDIPAYVGPDTLFIASSYSGNTEETVSALDAAEFRNCQIVTIESGGELKADSLEHNHPALILPGNLQPRYALFFGLRALAKIFEASGLGEDLCDEAEAAASHIKTSIGGWLPEVPTKNNLAKQIARKIHGTTPITYGGPLMKAAAYKWKISFNENAKNVSAWNEFSEFNHNEFIGWTHSPDEKPFSVIELRSSLEHQQIKKRYDLSNQLLKGHMPKPIEVEAAGESKLDQLLWAVQLGDFVSLYLAILNGVDPTPVDLIEKLKKQL